METQTKPYAIRCTTEEHVRECEKYGYYRWDTEHKKKKSINGLYMQVISGNHTVISYDEAISLGLLGEKEPVKESPSEDNLVENPIEKAVYDVSKKMSSELDKWILQLIKDRFRLETHYNGNTVRYELYTQYGKKPLGELEINLSSK